MHLPHESQSLLWPISSQAFAFARQVSRRYPDSIADQVFEQALAVSVVHNFLAVLGITSQRIDPAGALSDSQLGTNPSHLLVEDLGYLECHPLAEDAPIDFEALSSCENPDGDRIGDVFVCLQLEARQSVIQGFLPHGAVITRPWPPLRSVEYLLQHLHALMIPVVSITRWLSGLFEPEWQPFAQVFSLPRHSSFRLANPIEAPVSLSPPYTVSRAKSLQWPVSQSERRDACRQVPEPVIMALSATQLSPVSIQSSVRIYPAHQPTFSSSSLHLMIGDDAEHPMMSVRSRAIDNYLELQFKGMPGEPFQVVVRQGDYSVLEKFQL